MSFKFIPLSLSPSVYFIFTFRSKPTAKECHVAIENKGLFFLCVGCTLKDQNGIIRDQSEKCLLFRCGNARCVALPGNTNNHPMYLFNASNHIGSHIPTHLFQDFSLNK